MPPKEKAQTTQKGVPIRRNKINMSLTATPHHALKHETPADFEARMLALYDNPDLFVKHPTKEQNERFTKEELQLRNYHFRRTNSWIFTRRQKRRKLGIDAADAESTPNNRWVTDQLKEFPYNVSLADFPATNARREEIMRLAKQTEEKYGVETVLDSVRRFKNPTDAQKAIAFDPGPRRDFKDMGAGALRARQRLRNEVSDFKKAMDILIKENPVLKSRVEGEQEDIKEGRESRQPVEVPKRLHEQSSLFAHFFMQPAAAAAGKETLPSTHQVDEAKDTDTDISESSPDLAGDDAFKDWDGSFDPFQVHGAPEYHGDGDTPPPAPRRPSLRPPAPSSATLPIASSEPMPQATPSAPAPSTEVYPPRLSHYGPPPTTYEYDPNRFHFDEYFK